MIKQFDTLKSIIPEWILEDNPNFYDFLRHYYEWMTEKGYDQTGLYNHMDYMSLKKDMATYVNDYFDSRLPAIPNELLRDNVFMLRWSKQLNSMKGSPDIFHLLFYLFFDDEVVITYPSDDVLKLSAAKWIKPKHVIYTTLHNKEFTKSEIIQNIKVLDGSVKTFGVFDVLMLEIDNSYTNIVDANKPIISTNDDSEYVLNNSNQVKVVNGGLNHYVNEILFPRQDPTYSVKVTVTTAGVIALPVAFNNTSTLTVKANGNNLYTYDISENTLYSSLLDVGDVVEITCKGYTGEIQVTRVDNRGSVIEAVAYKPFIGEYNGNVAVGDCVFSLSHSNINKLLGYYENGLSRLDDQDKIQDSYYYQNYSYDISSTTSPDAYREMVKEYIHPSGFKLFTTALNDFYTNKSTYLQSINDIVDIDVVEFNRTAIRALGNCYKTAALSSNSFSVPPLSTEQLDYLKGQKGYLGYDYDMLCKMLIEEAYYIIYADDGSNNNNYDENAINDVTNFIRRDYIKAKYFNDVSSLYYATVGSEASSASLYIPYSYITEGYFKLDLTKIKDSPKGWMTRSNIAYVDFYYPQQYTVENDMGDTYFESGYVTEQ